MIIMGIADEFIHSTHDEDLNMSHWNCAKFFIMQKLVTVEYLMSRMTYGKFFDSTILKFLELRF